MRPQERLSKNSDGGGASAGSLWFEPVRGGRLFWLADEATPERSFNRVDLSVNEKDTATPLVAREITITIWIEVSKFRWCGTFVIGSPSD